MGVVGIFGCEDSLCKVLTDLGVNTVLIFNRNALRKCALYNYGMIKAVVLHVAVGEGHTTHIVLRLLNGIGDLNGRNEVVVGVTRKLGGNLVDACVNDRTVVDYLCRDTLG